MQTDSSRMVVFILNRYEHKCFYRERLDPVCQDETPAIKNQ